MSASTFQIALATSAVAFSSIEQIAREAARRALQKAIEDEVNDYLNSHRDQLDSRGHRLVVRNGTKDQRTILTGVGPMEVRQPRVDDRRVDELGRRFRFTSKILPPYLRKTKTIEELVPWLYLKGIGTNDMGDALIHLGFDGSGLSPTSVVRMKELWTGEYENWSKRSLIGKKYVYVWADGLYFGCRLSDERPCVLVLIGATQDGKKELLAIVDGERESEQSWTEILLDLKARGLVDAPKLAIGDGALGFWCAIRKVFPSTRHQRCWVHKTANILNKLPKHQQPKAKEMLHDIWLAGTREEAFKAFDRFVAVHEAKWPKANDCLVKDKDELLAFYDFPAEHWSHLRTSNPIESTFATVNLRTKRTKGPGSREAGLAMVFKLAKKAETGWRRLNGSALLPDVVLGIRFIDGVKQAA
jgi:putative transposase